jgi:hypothetical protein
MQVSRTFTSLINNQKHPQIYLDELQCNDCDRPLREEDAMDMDSFVREDMECRQCARTVCDFCAVGNLDLRRCLRCMS